MDLRQRLARFDRPRPEPDPGRAPDADPLRRLKERGACALGKGEAAPLRFEEELAGAVPTSILEGFGLPGDPGRVLVLDTETTGLESGTGTLVFLAGFVEWVGHAQRLVQFFLPEPVSEAEFLSAVLEQIGRADLLVSYNGRSFDLPRLRARMRLHRLDDAPLDRPHLDLLHPARRVARGWLPDARLATVESGLLGLDRADDLPGAFAPEVYRCLQLERRDEGLVEVLRHNALDVENLPRIADALARLWRGEGLEERPASVALQIARARFCAGATEVGWIALGCALDGDDRKVRRQARSLGAQQRRRAGDFEGAARLWREQLEDDGGDVRARVELAKLLEHRLRDRRGALTLVREARELVALQAAEDSPLSAALDHRYRRLVRKVGAGA